jgi:hypothetical protein
VKDREIVGERMLVGAIITLVVVRLALLPHTPPGFYVDEAAGAAHAKAMLENGTNAHGGSWPLFSESLGGGYTTPVYLYPLTEWARIFGLSETSLRYFSQMMTLAAIGLLAVGARYWLGTRFALTLAVVGLALPWGWLQGSLAWDPALVPFLISLAFLSFSVLLYSARPQHRWLAAAGLPLALVGLAYLYPPCRATVPLLALGFYGLLLRRRVIPPWWVGVSVVVTAALALPLLNFLDTPEARSRSAMLSVYTNASAWDGTMHVLSNFRQLLSPVFLFLEGDPNLRHSTGRQGMLGMASAIPALVLLAYTAHLLLRWWHRRDTRTREPLQPASLLIVVALGGAAAGLLGSALTYEGQPHSLRGCAAWPFLAILLAIGWTVLLRSVGRDVTVLVLAAFVLSTAAYALDLATGYRDRSAIWFDVPAREQLTRGDLGNYPEPAVSYYR